MAVPVGHVRIRDDSLVADEVVFFLRMGRLENGGQRQTSNDNQP